MNIKLTDKNLTQFEKSEIEVLLARKDKNIDTDLEQMWYLMDLIWDDLLCDNRNLNWKNIGEFYSHPVWLLNGLFQEQHAESMRHRHIISDWVIQNGCKSVVDYGGGFGTLARLIAEKDDNIIMNIYEPHPSEFGLKRVSEYSSISLIDKLDVNYDCLLSTDVLEHVPDPLNSLAEMIESVKLGGHLVIANAFYPMIKCHLPQDFHFRYSFNLFATSMGLKVIDSLDGTHATIFQKVEEKKINWNQIRRFEKISKKIFLVIEILKPVLRPIKRLFK